MPKKELTSQLTPNPNQNMNNQNTLPATPAEPLTFTDLTPQKFSAACRSTLEALKTQLVRKLTAEFSDLQSNLVRQAVDEAQALASLTVVPQLVLPTLAEEKVQSIHNWALHQRAIFQQPALAWAA
jgi:hypothetical protein